MTAVAWPSAVLPTTIPIEGFSHKRQPAGERTEMDSGLARFRVTNRNPLRRVTVGWQMTTFQIEYFNAWLEYQARYGGAWFSIDLPLDGTNRTVLARFVEEPGQQPWRRTRWGITAQLDVRDTNVLTSGVFGVIDAYGLTGMQEADAIIDTVSGLGTLFDTWPHY